MIAEFEIIFWYWWVASVVFLAIEILAPGFFFLWLAVSAFLTGTLVLFISGVSQEIQFFTFAVLSVIAFIGGRSFLKRYPTETDHPLLNRRGAQYIGRVFTLDQAIINGQGKMKVNDTIWKISGEDCDSNSQVKVVSVRGTVLRVEKL